MVVASISFNDTSSFSHLCSLFYSKAESWFAVSLLSPSMDALICSNSASNLSSKASTLRAAIPSRIFWFGDLNYRLYLEDNRARQLIKKQDWGALQDFDQLQRELGDGGVFQGWKEGNIQFAPTYKYSSSNRNRYSGGLPSKSGEKQRTPAWCDRILWYGKGVRQLSYFRSESKFSDHRPVSALFSTQIEVVKSTTSRVFPLPHIMPSITPCQTGQGTAKEEAMPTLLSLFVRDAEASPSHMEKML